MAASSFPGRGARLRTLLAAAAAAALAGCGSGLAFHRYEDPRLGADFDAPVGWTVYTDGSKGDLTAFALFVLEPAPKYDEQWLGPNLAVHKLSRRRADFHGSDADFEGYRAKRLSMAENVFKNVVPNASTMTIAGSPARQVSASFSINLPPTQGQKGGALPMRIVTAVIERPEAFYVIEYRSNERSFAAYAEVYERAKSSFQIR